MPHTVEGSVYKFQDTCQLILKFFFLVVFIGCTISHQIFTSMRHPNEQSTSESFLKEDVLRQQAERRRNEVLIKANQRLSRVQKCETELRTIPPNMKIPSDPDTTWTNVEDCEGTTLESSLYRETQHQGDISSTVPSFLGENFFTSSNSTPTSRRHSLLSKTCVMALSAFGSVSLCTALTPHGWIARHSRAIPTFPDFYPQLITLIFVIVIVLFSFVFDSPRFPDSSLYSFLWAPESVIPSIHLIYTSSTPMGFFFFLGTTVLALIISARYSLPQRDEHDQVSFLALLMYHGLKHYTKALEFLAKIQDYLTDYAIFIFFCSCSILLYAKLGILIDTE